MTTDTEARPDTTITARRRWLPAAAAGVLLAVGGLTWAIAGNNGNGNQPIAIAPTTAVSTPASVLKLTIGGKGAQLGLAHQEALQQRLLAQLAALLL